MGVLDNAGLAHFWGKVKDALSGKQDTITAGDGLRKEGDTLSVTTPTRGVVTQAEFDALPEEQRNKGLYVISDGGSGGGGPCGEVYSTEETRIGTWIDGKPLYRVVMSGTPLTNNRRFILGQIQNVEHIVFMYGSAIYSSGASVPIPYSSSNTYVLPEFSGEQDIVLTGTGVGNSVKYTLNIEYTKADEGGTA